ncbi:PAS domain S-box protein [Methanolobus sp. ZRKC2]|uniref:PAS domain S-box protein n=1 Tax=Methanolobus sp. ZRKC2 TaxID=3125783 RepID=UPI00324B39FC
MIDSDIVQNAPVGIFVVDKNDNFTVFNKSMEFIYGLLADDVVGKNLLLAFPEHTLGRKEGIRDLFLESKASLQQSSRKNVPVITPTNRLSYQSISFVPLVNESGAYDGMIGYIEESIEHISSEKGLLDEISSAREQSSVYRDIPIMVFRWSAENGWPVLFVSQNISQLGYTKKEFESGAIRYIDIVHPDDREKLLLDTLRFEMAEKVYFSGDYRLLSKSGDTVWVNELSLIKKEGDIPFRYDGIVIDITKRKQAEASLQTEHDRLERITSSMGIGLAVISRDFHTVWANNVLKDIFGDVENKLCYEIYNNRQDICEKCAVKAVFENSLDRSVSEQYGTDKDGNPIWSQIIATPIKDEDGNITAAMEVVVPLTERKLKEIELNESKARIESILRSAPVGIGVVRNGIVEDVNDMCCDILGYSREELIGQNTRTFFEVGNAYSDVESVMKSGIKEHGVGTMDVQARRRDGNIIDLLISATPMYSDNHSKGISFTIMDITEKKRNERELKKRSAELEQLNRLKDLFSDIIRHDLLNPAGTIKGYSEILEELEEDENKLNLLQMIRESNKRLIDLIENASKYEKLNSIDEIDYSNDNLVEIFQRTILDFEQPLKQKNINVSLSSEGPCVYAVNPLVSEVFANLLSNAIKYSPADERINVHFHKNESSCKVTVADHGDGIPDEDKAFVFNRFKRLDKKGVKGTGLGLAIVKRIMELHNGSYGVEDNPEGKGCVFWVTFSKADM